MFEPKEQHPSPVEAAKAEVARLFALEADLTEKRREKIAAVVVMEHDAGTSVMEGRSIQDAATSVLQAQAEVRVIEGAIRTARQQRMAAIRRRYEVEAAALRSQAATLRNEATEIRKACEPWLRRIRQAEAVPENALPIWAPLYEDPTHDIAKFTARQLGQPEPEFPPTPPRPNLAGPLLKPRTVALEEEADRMEEKARDLDVREIHSSYSLTKSTAAELLASEEFRNPEALVPATHVVESWLNAVEARAERLRPELLKGERLRQYKLTWKDGRIDTDYSSLTFLNTGIIASDACFTAEIAE